MTSFLWVQRDQSVAKIVSHSASRRNVLPLRDRQKPSSKVAIRRPTPAACHAAWAKGQAKNQCEQSSTTLAHTEHSTDESEAMRCRRDLVIRRRRRRSQVNTLIFTRSWRFHTKRHRCKRSGSFKSSWPRRSLYAAWAIKLGPLHTHASWVASNKRWSARSSCRLSSSATRWSGNASGKAGTQASCQACRTETLGFVDNAWRRGNFPLKRSCPDQSSS